MGTSIICKPLPRPVLRTDGDTTTTDTSSDGANKASNLTASTENEHDGKVAVATDPKGKPFGGTAAAKRPRAK